MRRQGIIGFISRNDVDSIFSQFDRKNLVFFDRSKIDQCRANKDSRHLKTLGNTLSKLSENAEKYLNNPDYSVMDKTTLPPSGDKHDYWHPAPYAWPNPDSADGLPYIYKDGQRVPGTRMYEEQSIKYDRTSIQRVFDESTALALAGEIFSNELYTQKAVSLIRKWFLDESTLMNPHLTFSQVVMGKNKNCGTPSGLIETKDMYFFLDAVRIVSTSKYWTSSDEQRMFDWCVKFLNWLKTSEQGIKEVATKNNHGVAFDLQTYALASYIGDLDEMYEIFLRSMSRLKGHFDVKGFQPHEMTRTTTAHYTAFNLHLWLNLNALIKATTGKNLIAEKRTYGSKTIEPLKKATAWVLDRAAGDWPYQQIDEFDKSRYEHLYHGTASSSPSCGIMVE